MKDVNPAQKQYKHLFFDLDHTLWDFEKNSAETLNELYLHFELAQKLNVHPDKFVQEYSKLNRKLWKLYDLRKINKEELRNTRFNTLFQQFRYKNELLADEINHLYIETCPKKGNLIEGALETLQFVKNEYQIHIITNGFQEIQRTKIEYSGLQDYIQELITSDNSGHHKPHPGIFRYGLAQTGAKLEESIMIGDNLITDIKGAKQVRMDHVFYNPDNTQKGRIKVQHEVKELVHLKQILI